jgi:putative hydrolase of the HAD superfamily
MSSTAGIDPKEIDAVVFDIGGVFLIRHWEPVCRGMGRGGYEIEPDPDRFHGAHYHAVRALSNHINGTMDESSRDFWSNFERGYLTHLGIEAGLLEDAVHTMFTEVFDKEPHPIWRFLLHDNIAGFRRIAEAGVPVAIVTNNDGTAERQLIDFGICQVGEGPLTNVAAVADSGVLGIAKPDPRIFTPALVALGVDPARALYVGDTVHADVHGARAAGMPVMQLDPYGLFDDFDHARLPDVNAIADFLLGE